MNNEIAELLRQIIKSDDEITEWRTDGFHTQSQSNLINEARVKLAAWDAEQKKQKK